MLGPLYSVYWYLVWYMVYGVVTLQWKEQREERCATAGTGGLTFEEGASDTLRGERRDKRLIRV